MKRPLHLLAALAATAIAPASSDWTYLEPMYACSPRNSNAPAGNCNLNTHSCLANPNHPQATDDAACAACASDQTYWPCDVDGLCYCWEEGTSKIPPAPSTRIYNGGEGLNVSTVDPCDIVTEEIFKAMAPMAMAPYSYEGFCTAVHKYNENHPDEGVFNMGTLAQQKAELAAFFGNVLHESDDMKAGREYLMCADRVEMGGETYCKPCDVSSFDWDTMTCPGGASLASEGRAFNNYCQSNLLPPEGCECDDVYERAEQGPMAGYVKSDDVYFGRGAIQLSWNYNYIKASVALTGAPQTFCQRPDLVATTPEYAIGAGLFFWMENVKNDRTCHQGVLLEEDFGKTLDTINGGLECPADSHGWHGKAVQLRLNRYCRAASAIGVERLLSLDGCMGMDKRMTQCLDAGTCPDCRDWEESYLASQASRAGDAEDEVEVAVVESQGSGKKKDKNPNKQQGKNPNKQQNGNGGGGGGRAKALKQQEIAAAEEAPAAAEEEAAVVDDGKFDQKKAKEMQKLKKEAAARGMTLEELAEEKGIELDYSLLATERPKPKDVQEEEEDPIQEEEEELPKAAEKPTQEEAEPPKAESASGASPAATPTAPTPPIHSALSEEAACTGAPCHIPNGRSSDRLAFCRAANGICGMGPAYCNERSVWTAECPPAAGDGASEGGHDVATSASFASAGTDMEEDAGEVVSTPKKTRPPTPPRMTRSPTPPPQSAGASVSSSASKFGATPVGHGKGKSDGKPAISSAGQFGSGGKPAPKPPSSPAKSEPAPAKPKAPAGPPSAMAFMTHAKGRNIPVDVEEGTENAHAAPSASQFGGMTNWANTKLEHPPTLSPVVAPGKGDAGAMADAHYVVVPTPTPPPTRLPTKLPTERPVKVINIADAFSTFSSLEDEPEDEVGEEDKEEEAIGMSGVGSDAAVAEEVPMLQSAKSETAEEPNASPESYYSRTSPSSYEFSPLDDVTLSRTYSDQNFGASPSIVVDMLEGDAALLRFDLSIIGDGTIEKAVLRLTPKEEDGTTSGGVYYIQPVVNGWTEDGVTYATSPKADGSLFASVASRSDDGKYELDVTKAAANHVISFRVVGTDRVRSEFSSKEAADSNRAPVLTVALESNKEAPMIETPKAELNEADSSASEMLSSAKGQGSGGKGELSSAKRPDTNELDASSSSAASLKETGAQSPSGGRIFGHIWLDRNADGLQDSTEPGLRGILVDLYECDGDLWLEGTRTAAGGDFIFEDLHEGSYYVDVTAGADLGFSAKGAATERSVRDSDVDQATGRSDCIELSSSSGLSVSVNAGIVKPTPGASPSTATAEALVTPATSSTSVSVPKIDEDAPDYNCRGRPCTEGPEYCRSKHNFCGSGDEYCNEDSQWTSECGTPSPTLKPTGAPTTGLPTFVHDPDAHCAGDPCIKGEEGDGTWCRSEIGYCGSGPLYCNSASLWVPECDAASAGGSSSLKDVAASFAAGEVDVSSIISNSTSDDEEDIPTETPTYFPTKGDEEFSSFVLPTLSHIVTPKQTDISALKKGHGSGSTNSVESDGDASLSTDTASSEPGSDDDGDQSSTKENQAPNTGENSVENEPWYIRYSNLEPVSRSAGLRLSTSAAASFCAAMAALRLL